MVEIIYFVHGTTTDNEAGISSGWKDVDLSELGINQSKQLPEQIGEVEFDAVFSSDLIRAIHSANLSFEGTAPIYRDARLRECNYGEYNGYPSRTVEPLQERKITESFSGGESYEDVKNRIADFLEFLSKKYQNKHVAIVAHKAPQLALDVLLKDMTWEQAFAEDWRKTHAWQPGWEYELK